MRLLGLLALLAAVAVHAAVPVPSETDGWTVLTAGEFRIYSNASAHATRQIAVNLLRMREALGKVTTLNVRAAKPIHVFVFRNRRAFAPYRDALFEQRNAPVSGGFVQGMAANAIVLDAAAEGGVARVVYHELTHALMRNTVPGLPLWLDEGLAEYYSTFSVRGDEVRIGYPVSRHVLALRKPEPLIPLARHFVIDQQSPEYEDPRQHARFYAQSWALVHYFLWGGKERRARLEAFLEALRAGKPAAEATALLGTDYPAIEVELLSYVKRPAMAFLAYRVDELTVPVPEDPKPVARDELLYALGSLFTAHSATAADGERMLAEAVRLNPSRAKRPAVEETLQETPESAAVHAAEELYAQGKQEEAIAAMRALLAATQDAALREHLQGVIGIHEERTARELQTKAMDAIIAAAREGKTGKALTLLDALLPKVTDEQLRTQLAAMRRELVKRR
jgi:hypothetical protein